MSTASSQSPASLLSATRVPFIIAFVTLSFVFSSGGVGSQAGDDHGNGISTATGLPLGSSIEGGIYPADDQDVFRLDLSGTTGTTDVWIYTTGDLDTVGYLFDSEANPKLANDDSRIVDRWNSFHLRASLSPGVYYLIVISFGREQIGDYTLHAEEVTDPGSTIDGATRLSPNSPMAGTISSSDDADYFRIEFTEPKNVVLYAENPILFEYDDIQSKWIPKALEPLSAHVLDNRGSETSVNIYPVPRFGTHRGFLIRDDFGPGTHFVKIVAESGVDSYPVPYTIHTFEDVRYGDFIDECEADTRLLNDPLIRDSLYSCQWHFQESQDQGINVELLWADDIKGRGVNVAVVDDGMYHAHEDLRDNVYASRNHDYGGNDDIYTPFEHHGTHVAGIIAARDNEMGVRGVAPRANVYGYNYLVDTTTLNRADAMTRNNSITAVSNNSWGPVDGPWLGRADALWERAIETGITDGLGGKGVFYVFAGGNGGRDHQLSEDGTIAGGSFVNALGRGDDSNLDEIANFYGVTAVCAVNDHDVRSNYSEKGANLWVCAPSNDASDVHRSILTTENSDRYYEEFGGTSASTPIVAGVAALVRGTNPNLTWRDVKLILAASARKNDSGNPGWEDGARLYGAGSDDDRYHFNHEYGFGVVDALAAVDLARGWTAVPPLESYGASSMSSTVIPNPGSSGPVTVTSEVTVNTDIGFTEFVEVRADFFHTSFRDLEIELVSPLGVISRIAVPFNTRPYTETEEGLTRTFYVELDGLIRFGSAKHLGEDPNGRWTLRIADHYANRGGILRSWTIKVFGHKSRPGAPTLDTLTPGLGSLTAAWSAPADIGSSPVTSYDLRYILQNADETVETNWTTIEGVWTDAVSGNLEYVVSSLSGGVSYDVQVRAKNELGAGPWSSPVTGIPLRITTGECGTAGAVSNSENNQELVADCNALLVALELLSGSATLNWSADTPLPEWEGITVGGSPKRVTEINLDDSDLTGAIPTELSRLTGLRELTLSRNKLIGPVPGELGTLVDLQELSLWGNRLSGPIPESIGDLANLEKLNLSQNLLTGEVPSSFGGLVNLAELSLWRNRLTGPLPEELGNLVNVKRLVLSSNQLTGELPDWLGGLSQLESLSLWGNEFSGPIPSGLDNLVDLKELYLAQNRLTGPIPSSLGSLANLEVLSVWRNLLSGPVPEELGNLTELERLLLRENRLTGAIPASLAELSSLQQLTLRQNLFEWCIPEGLRDLEDNDFDELSLPFCDVLLSDLAISPGTLVQTFDPYGTDYTALSSAAQVTVTAVSEHSAEIMFLNRNDHAIADADSSLDGHQVDLNSGITVIRVSTTSSDGLSSYVYDLAVSRVPSAPTVNAITAGDGQLSVSWTAPDETGGSDIAAYDLRYIRTVDLDSEVADWNLVENVWTTAGHGDLRHEIAGLTGSTEYGLQVRAVTQVGAGIWSDTATQTTTESVCVGGGAVTDAAHPGLISDCEALLDARDTLAGTGSLNWSRNLPIAEWDGVTPQGTPERVVWLNIRGGGLNGSIPSVLGRLTGLTYLNLRSNDLTGQIPSELGNLTGLTYLNLHSNRLSGRIPDSLGNLTNLRELWLHANHRGNDPTSGLSGRIPAAFGNLSKLEKVKLRNNRLSGSIPASLGRLDNLEWFVVHNNQLAGQIPPELGDMDSLQLLWLGGNELSGSIPPELGRLSTLTQLHLRTNRLTGSIPSELGNMASLRRMWIHQNELNGTLPKELGELANLEILNLRANQLTGSIPAELGNLTKLRDLLVHDNQLDGRIPSELGGLSSLRRMWLSQNRLIGAIPPTLGGLPVLTQLNLHTNRLSGSIPQELVDLVDTLTRLRLSGNRLSGCIPSGLSVVPDNDLDALELNYCPQAE